MHRINTQLQLCQHLRVVGDAVVDGYVPGSLWCVNGAAVKFGNHVP